MVAFGLLVFSSGSKLYSLKNMPSFSSRRNDSLKRGRTFEAPSEESLKKAGRLLPYTEANVGGLEPGSFDADKTYFGSKLITTGIAVNTSAKMRPKSFADLAKPEYKCR